MLTPLKNVKKTVERHIGMELQKSKIKLKQQNYMLNN